MERIRIRTEEQKERARIRRKVTDHLRYEKKMEEIKAYSKKYYEENREEILKKRQDRYKKYREHCLRIAKKHYYKVGGMRGRALRQKRAKLLNKQLILIKECRLDITKLALKIRLERHQRHNGQEFTYSIVDFVYDLTN